MTAQHFFSAYEREKKTVATKMCHYFKQSKLPAISKISVQKTQMSNIFPNT